MIFWCQVLAPEGEQAMLSLNRNQIKYIVILAMLIDHIAWAFVPLASWQGQIMHMIGRLTGPTMAYFIAEGYVHTRSMPRDLPFLRSFPGSPLLFLSMDIYLFIN